MKKYILFLAFVLITFIAKGEEKQISIGIQVTPTVSSLRLISGYMDYDLLPVISYGATFDYKLRPNVYLNSGLLFDRRGGRISTPVADDTGFSIGTITTTNRFDYLTIPLILNYYTSGKTRFYMGGGAYLGFLASNKISNSEIEGYPAVDYNNIEFSRKIDFGLALNLGLLIPIQESFLMDIGIRNLLGVFGTAKEKDSLKTNALGFQLGVKYKI